MEAAGWTINVGRFPSPNNLELLASIDFTTVSSVTDAHRARASVILRRTTDRLPFAAPTDCELFDPMVGSTFADGDAHLDGVSDDVRHKLAEASQLSESLRLDDSSYHAELDWWTAPLEATEAIPYGSRWWSSSSSFWLRGEVVGVSAVRHHWVSCTPRYV
jgi:hypothetical protein